MPITTQKRKPLYRRVREIPLRLQERDAEIIRQVFKHRFLTSEHIAALAGGSHQGVLRRLQKLFHAGYLDRPPEQIRPYKSGSDPMVYGLGNRGADLLLEKFDIPRSKVDWTSKNRETKIRFLDHTIQTAHFMVCFELACRGNPDAEFIGPEVILSRMPEQLRKKENPWSWKVTAKIDVQGEKRMHTMGMVPDKVLGLRFFNREPNRNRLFFFLEADRSTMPVKSANIFRSSFYKKMLGYFHSWEQELFEKSFPFKRARVLTVTKSEERIESMVATGRELDPKGRGLRMFLFVPEKQLSLKEPRKIFEKIWTDGRGEKVGLID